MSACEATKCSPNTIMRKFQEMVTIGPPFHKDSKDIPAHRLLLDYLYNIACQYFESSKEVQVRSLRLQSVSEFFLYLVVFHDIVEDEKAMFRARNPHL